MRVECCGVSKRFGRVHALRDIRLDIPSGCAVALVGPNGSGKSTLTRAIMGLIAIRGEIRFDGESRSDARSARRIANRIAYIPQIAPQVASPVGELVRAICDVREARPTDVVAVARAPLLELRYSSGMPVGTAWVLRVLAAPSSRSMAA